MTNFAGNSISLIGLGASQKSNTLIQKESVSFDATEAPSPYPPESLWSGDDDDAWSAWDSTSFTQGDEGPLSVNSWAAAEGGKNLTSPNGDSWGDQPTTDLANGWLDFDGNAFLVMNRTTYPNAVDLARDDGATYQGGTIAMVVKLTTAQLNHHLASSQSPDFDASRGFRLEIGNVDSATFPNRNFLRVAAGDGSAGNNITSGTDYLPEGSATVVIGVFDTVSNKLILRALGNTYELSSFDDWSASTSSGWPFIGSRASSSPPDFIGSIGAIIVAPNVYWGASEFATFEAWAESMWPGQIVTV